MFKTNKAAENRIINKVKKTQKTCNKTKIFKQMIIIF